MPAIGIGIKVIELKFAYCQHVPIGLFQGHINPISSVVGRQFQFQDAVVYKIHINKAKFPETKETYGNMFVDTINKPYAENKFELDG